MLKFIKIGDQWFRRDGFNLVATDAPADLETVDVFDATDLAAELDALDVAGVTERTGELVATYETARTAATAGDNGALQAAQEAMLPAMVATQLKNDRLAAVADLGEPPAEDDADADADPEASTDDDASGDASDDDAANDDEGSVLDGIVIPNDASSLADLPAGDLATVAAAAKIMAKRNGSPDAFASLMPGGAPAGGAPARAETAALIAGGGNRAGLGAGTAMDEAGYVESLQRFARGAAGGRVSSEIIGRYEQFGPSPALVASAKPGEASVLSGDFHARRAGHHGIVAAAPDRCGPSDVRREIPDCGDISSPLLNALQSYPAPHCKLEYYRDITLASVSDGITVWDTTARDAYQAALDTFRATPNATNLAALKAAEKTCTIAGCAPTAEVTMLPIAACLEYPTDLEYCSPESIRAYRRALQRLFVRERASNMLAVVQTLSSTVTVDAAAAPFVNTEASAVQLGAGAVVDYVISALKSQGVVAERVTEGNYSAILPYGLQMALELDGRLAWGIEQIENALGVPVITAMDTATGTALPYGAVPAAGSTTAFSALRFPTDWDIFVLDLDDFFEISRPDIEVGAQITPETIRGNMVFGGFMESSAGYGKDGCHPAWHIQFSNLVYNGARPDRMNPVGLLA